MTKPAIPSLPSDPLWYKDAVIYEIHVRAYRDSNGDGIGDFRGLIEKLDYIEDLGVTALWLLPFYPSPLRDGGYDIADYFDIHANYGNKEDFILFMQEAHRRGLRVITELVINHTSSEHAWFQRARRSPPGSPYRDFYVWSDTPDKYRHARIIFQDFETSNWSWDPVAKAYYWHRFYAHQPDLNFENPAVHEAIFEVVNHWLELGVDGVRLDAIPYLYEEDGTNCENLPETHAFLKKLRAYIDSKFDSRMLLAEANQWPIDAASYFGDGDECHMNFHFPLMPRLFMAVNMEDAFPVVDILRQTPAIPPNCQWATFLRNHDELTLEMVTEEDRDYMYRVYAREDRARINLGIRRRLSPLLGERRRVELMNMLLFSLPGTPVIYYGDEIGMGDNIYLGDRDGVRTPMQWSSDRNAGFSEANPQRLYLPTILDPEYHYEAINVDAQSNNPQSLLWWMKKLISHRKQHKVLSRGDIEFVSSDNNKVLAFIRTYENERMLVVANLSRFVQHASLELAAFDGAVPVEVFGKTRFPRIGARPYGLSIAPHTAYWFDLEALDRTSVIDMPAARAPMTVTGDWMSLLEPARKAELGPRLLAYIRQQRWFRGKARSPRSAEIVDVVPLTRGPDRFALAFVRVDYPDDHQTYVVPVGFACGEKFDRLQRKMPEAIFTRAICKGETTEEGGLFDAAASEPFSLALLDAVRTGTPIIGRVGRLVGSLVPETTSLLPEEVTEPKLGGFDQTNSVIVFGDRAIVKLIRLVEHGVQAEAEISRALLKGPDYPRIPRLLFSLEYHTKGTVPATLGLGFQFVPNRGDAWSLSLDSYDTFYERLLTPEVQKQGVAEEVPQLPYGVDAEAPASLVSLASPYFPLMEQLAERTAELHLALAAVGDTDPAFRPEPFTLLYQQSIYQSARGILGRTFELLRRNVGSLPPERRELAERLLGREKEIDTRLRSVTKDLIDVMRIRIHGDYHLGQVLYTGDDFVILDLEGEPARPIHERRYKRCALRDVAGMVRSFQYAAESTLRRGRERPEDLPRLRTWGNALAAWAGRAFTRKYLARIGDRPLVPKAPEDIARLLDFYLLEKCIYEIGYELNNRPDWVEVPLLGLETLLDLRAGR